MNKRALYESIMQNVAKQVKKALNEGKLEFNELDFIGRTIKDMVVEKNSDELVPELANTFFINIDLGVDMPNQLKQQIIKNSVGFFVEGIFTNMLMEITKYGINTMSGVNRDVKVNYNGNGALHDITMTIESLGEYSIEDGQVGEDTYGEEINLTPGDYTDSESRTFDFEIKAFNGKTGNITLTGPQRDVLNNANGNVYYILVDYSLSGSVDKPGINIKHVYILDSDEATGLITSNHINTNVLQNAYLVF